MGRIPLSLLTDNGLAAHEAPYGGPPDVPNPGSGVPDADSREGYWQVMPPGGSAITWVHPIRALCSIQSRV